jgi:hypothetical protein
VATLLWAGLCLRAVQGQLQSRETVLQHSMEMDGDGEGITA